MKITLLKNYLVLFSMALLLLAVGCKDDNKVASAAMLSGDESKTWKAVKESNASGEMEKIARDERKQTMQFFANGSFSMQSPTQSASGKWTYDAMAKKLTLEFVGSEMTETFEVRELNDDEMILQGSSSTMEFEAD